MTDRPTTGMRRRSVVLTAAILVFFLLVLAAAYIESPLSKVRTVRVSGNSGIPSGQLIRDSGIQAGENQFQIPVQGVQSRILADFPIIKSVSIRRNLLSRTVTIQVREKTVAGILEANGTLYQVLADGTVLNRDPAGVGVNLPILSTTLPISVSLGQRIKNPGLLALCRELPSLSPSDLESLSQLSVQPIQGRLSVLAFTRDGFEIEMPIGHLGRSLRLYEAIRKKLGELGVPPGLIDLLTSRTGVYRPYKNK